MLREIVDNFAPTIGDGPVGISFPAPARHGVIPFIANLDQGWAGLHAEKYISDALGRPVTVLNDADAAGVGEVHYGAAREYLELSFSPLWAPASALPSSITASCCRTPSLGTSRLMVTTPRSALPPRLRIASTCLTRTGQPSVCSVTTRSSRCSFPRSLCRRWRYL